MLTPAPDINHSLESQGPLESTFCILQLLDRESRFAPTRYAVLDLNPRDSRAMRASPDGVLEPSHRNAFSLSQRLDAPIRPIFHPAVNPFPLRHGLGEIPETNPLHSATDDKASSDAHK
jgi:hypothetical protein